MVNSIKFPKAYSEVYNFINALGDSYINKIPTSIYNSIKNNRDVNYNPKFDINQKIEEGMISQEGLALIAALNLQYWCKDEKEKLELKQSYINNTKQEDEKYSYENLFKNSKAREEEILNNNIETASENTTLIEYKESVFKKFINMIKKIFLRKQ